MRYMNENCEILYKTEIAPGVFDIILKSPGIAGMAAPGQFVTILCAEYPLRRPISICGFDKELGTLRLVFEIRGKGTGWLAGMEPGSPLDLIGPLGHGFPLEDKAKKAVLVGGGIGTPPLIPLAKHYGENAAAITGFRNSGAAILQDDITKAGASAILCTDDGSGGFHGFTTQALAAHLEAGPCDIIYTCGPMVMMRGVAAIARKHNIPCFVSLEERMGCGIGACLVCTCRTKSGKGAQNTRVCLNGPVFNEAEVDWDA